jgi:copper chaperone CopZ
MTLYGGETTPAGTITYTVGDIDRGDAESVISTEVGSLPGVDHVEVRRASKQVAVTGRDLDGGAIHDAIHRAGYSARRVIELSEPYIARPVAALGVWKHSAWRMKEYTIAYRRDAARPELIHSAETVAAETLPTPAITPTRYGVGFLGIHDGRGGCLVFVDWWEQENDLHHHVFLAPDADPSALRPATPGDLAACVWDLSIMAHEREAWNRHVFAAHTPNLDAYLEDQLSGMI